MCALVAMLVGDTFYMLVCVQGQVAHSADRRMERCVEWGDRCHPLLPNTVKRMAIPNE
jgi:hypothetical protein